MNRIPEAREKTAGRAASARGGKQRREESGLRGGGQEEAEGQASQRFEHLDRGAAQTGIKVDLDKEGQKGIVTNSITL